MTHSLPQFAEEVQSACIAGAQEAGAALTRAFAGEIQLAPGQPTLSRSAAGQLDLGDKGLIILLKTDRTNVVITVPATKGLVPDWCAKPDKTGESKLATLAQELGMNLLPDTWIAQDFSARWVDNLAEALDRGGVPADALGVPLGVTQGGRDSGVIGIFWPVNQPDELFAAPRKEPPATILRKKPVLSSGDLPPYTKSLLRIRVPVVVTLAQKRQPLNRIIELGPGSIIQFDKSCEEMLELEVGNRSVACGEAVKVGDKFGLRITTMVLPDERFNPVKKTTA